MLSCARSCQSPRPRTPRKCHPLQLQKAEDFVADKLDRLERWFRKDVPDLAKRWRKRLPVRDKYIKTIGANVSVSQSVGASRGHIANAAFIGGLRGSRAFKTAEQDACQCAKDPKCIRKDLNIAGFHPGRCRHKDEAPKQEEQQEGSGD